jgi:hypothetical protein
MVLDALLWLRVRDMAHLQDTIDKIRHSHGVTGDGSVASTERGQVWIERVVGFTVDFVNHYDQVTAEMQREG